MSDFIEKHGASLFNKILEHLSLSMSALAIACLIAIPLGIIVSRKKKLSSLMVAIASILQTIPSLALLAIMVPILGVGKVPAILGMQAVDVNIMDAAKGMGMSTSQQIIKVQLPLASPIIFSGVRLSATYVLAWATLASYIGAGGIGDLIFAGLNNYNISLIIVGTLSITLLTLLVDAVFSYVEKKLSPNTESAGV